MKIDLGVKLLKADVKNLKRPPNTEKESVYLGTVLVHILRDT